MSLPEVLLWTALKAEERTYKFRRQHQVEPYVLDFFCAKVGLDVEVDSRWHDQRLEADRERDRFLLSKGYCVLRISAIDVLESPEACAKWALNACREVDSWRASGCPSGFKSSEYILYP